MHIFYLYYLQLLNTVEKIIRSEAQTFVLSVIDVTGMLQEWKKKQWNKSVLKDEKSI